MTIAIADLWLDIRIRLICAVHCLRGRPIMANLDVDIDPGTDGCGFKIRQEGVLIARCCFRGPLVKPGARAPFPRVWISIGDAP